MANQIKTSNKSLSAPVQSTSQVIANDNLNTNKSNKTKIPINYNNGRKIEPIMYNFANYFMHKEKLPKHYHPLVQYLDQTEVKYHNDNLYENSPIGFPTRAQLLKERLVRLPIIKYTSADRERYKRKLLEQQQNLNIVKRKYDFTTYDDYSSHAFLTGARFNRNDTIDSKILTKYGMFINRNNPESIYLKSNRKAFESISDDLQNMPSAANRPAGNCHQLKSFFMQIALILLFCF